MSEIYRDQVLAVEPTGIEPVTQAQRHGHARDLFSVWFSANAEIATWMVGVFIVALYGTDLRSAIIGIIAGNLIGFAILGILATLGPRYGVPQMVASRIGFGRKGNIAPAALSFLAGVGWFAVNTIFGAYALETISGMAYTPALLAMLALQTLLAVLGYNFIHRFERITAYLLTCGFAFLAVVTFEKTNWSVAFNAHAPLALGGPVAGLLFAGALAFSYALGWVPCASDYSRYLPKATSRRAIFTYSLLGCAVPCIILEVMGAATLSATHADLASMLPTTAIAQLLGGSGWLASIVLATVTLGTLTANTMNIYSGALAALVAFSVRVPRWVAAVVVGVLGALLATLGAKPGAAAESYTNFLLLLSYWASPWAGVTLVTAITSRRDPAQAVSWGGGAVAWVAGLAASIPFWNQAWFIGPVPRAYPQAADLSYYVGFIVAALLTWLFAAREVGTSTT